MVWAWFDRTNIQLQVCLAFRRVDFPSRILSQHCLSYVTSASPSFNTFELPGLDLDMSVHGQSDIFKRKKNTANLCAPASITLESLATRLLLHLLPWTTVFAILIFRSCLTWHVSWVKYSEVSNNEVEVNLYLAGQCDSLQMLTPLSHSLDAQAFCSTSILLFSWCGIARLVFHWIKLETNLNQPR